MDDSSDSSIFTTDHRPADDADEADTPNEIIEDMTGDIDDPLSGSASPKPLTHGSDGTPVIKPRSYQLEMVEESMRRNIIVAMDTGSGKTHIAVLRILLELERMPSNQFIWFLAPTVSLCSQQTEYLQAQISNVQIKLLSGADGVDRWTEQSLWNAVLKNVKVVVSTYQILLDALTHAFVAIDSLALIVFDEVHNCVGKHPGAKIMQSFYRSMKSEGSYVPDILGLSASPIMRSDPLSLNRIEETMDAIARTPTEHRAELRLHVKLPILSQVCYEHALSGQSMAGHSKSVRSLEQAFSGLKIADDPYVIGLIHEDSERSRRKLERVRLNHKTWCHDQMKSFYSTTLKICTELGPWAADHYISEVIGNVRKLGKDSEDYLSVWDISNAERQYLAKVLSGVEVSAIALDPASSLVVSDKVSKLIQVLVEEASPNFSGIVFVKERATTEVLAHVLSSHPSVRGLFKIGTMVGTSAHAYRARQVTELVDLKSQKHVLSRFRSGAINLVIATSVLEEGIDVPACNVVICFEKPANLKSFVQRRGRARKRDSKLILLLDPKTDNLGNYEQLELVMKRMYEDEQRELQELLLVEDGEEGDGRSFRVNSTGALLDLDNVVPHLYHFCSTLPAKDYVDLRPEFICTESGADIQARVILPLSVCEAVRQAKSRKLWKSERCAIRDASFEAYIALYKAGLVNDNLLPLLRQDEVIDELTASTVEKRASIMTVAEQINPWVDIATRWESAKVGTMSAVKLSRIRVGEHEVQILLPVQIPQMPQFRLYWDSSTEILVQPGGATSQASSDILEDAVIETLSIFQVTFGARFPIKEMQPIMPICFNAKEYLGTVFAQRASLDQMELEMDPVSTGLIRDICDANRVYIYDGWISSKPPISAVKHPYKDYESLPQDLPHLSLTRLPRRFDFLHPAIQYGHLSTKEFSSVLPVSRCVVDELPFRYVQVALLMPSIMRRYEIYLIAQKLSATILKDVGISDLSLIATAISASSANEDTNYQRLEFLGDSILKLCTSVQLMAEYPLWHEGYLSAKKDRLVSNSRLSRTAVQSGLDKFIITSAFNGYKWRPIYAEDSVETFPDAKRDMSSKVLADVVEALIGAAMVDGGIAKALKCLQVFLPELSWRPLQTRQFFLFQRAPDMDMPATFRPLEDLIGYRFRKPSLLIEAMTHASYNTGFASLERFEYLGDAILDKIVVTEMYGHDDLTHIQMHLLRTALVNADFLAFLCMEWSTEQETSSVEEVTGGAAEDKPVYQIKKKSERFRLPLWRFMRHASPHLGAVQVRTAQRHLELRGHIRNAIETGASYPWALLAKLQAHKFYSDVVESLLGAVWIDSGSFDVCRELAERMGILPYLRRILEEDVHVWHPKEELGRLADWEKVRYVVERDRRGGGERPPGDEGVWYRCRIYIGIGERERLVADVKEGVNKVEVMTKAADQAIRTWRAGQGTVEETGVLDGTGKEVLDGDDDVVMIL